MKAFNGSPDVKAGLLDQIDADVPVPILDPAYLWQEHDLRGWSDDNGLPQVLTMLAATLVEGSQGDDSGTAFVREFLSAIEPGSDLRSVAHHFVEWAWKEAPDPLDPALGESDLRKIVEEIVERHHRAANGETIEPREWRPLRSRLTLLADAADEVDAIAARVIGATAWDFETSPGACGDMLQAWAGLVHGRKRTAIGWTDEKQAARDMVVAQMMARINARLPAAPPRTDEAAFKAHQAARTIVAGEEMAAVDDPIYAEWQSAMGEMTGAIRTLRDQCRIGLVGLVRQAAAVSA